MSDSLSSGNLTFVWEGQIINKKANPSMGKCQGEFSGGNRGARR